jgi:glycosyltransferase involved in cell wall biosynthesis
MTRKLKKFVLNNCENLTVVSNSMKVAVMEMGCTCQVDILPMGTDLDTKFVPDYKKQEPKNIIFVGRLIAQKGVSFLLQSFPEVVKVHPDVTLHIIGHGPELISLKKLAKDLGIERNVIFVGGIPYDDITSYLQSSSVAVFPYCRNKQDSEEGFGLVIIEALGCGCAVIASRQTAIMEIIKEKQTGLLINEGDPAGISHAILKLLNEPTLRKSLAETGRAEVLKQFSWAQISQSYTNLIQSCLTNK